MFDVTQGYRRGVELGYLTAAGTLVTVDTLAWRTLFPGIRFAPASGTLQWLSGSIALERRSDVTIKVWLHRRGWGRAKETVLRETLATWYRGPGLDLFVGPKAQSIRVPWRGELAKVHRPFFALEGPIKGYLQSALAHEGAPCLVWLDHVTVLAWHRVGAAVEVSAVERKEFSDFILGSLTATIEFGSEVDAKAFCDSLPPGRDSVEPPRDGATDISRSKRVVWTPKVLGLVLAAAVIVGLVAVGATIGALEGEYTKAAQAAIGSVSGLALLSWALPALLRVRRREFVDLTEKWPRVLCERWGADHQAQAQRAAEVLRSMGLAIEPGRSPLTRVDAFLRALPPETFYGTLGLQVGLLTIERVLYLTGREMEFWWQYLPDRKECAFRVDAAGLRLYPLTAVLLVWQKDDPEGLEPFARIYARELQMRLAFRESLRAVVALGFTAEDWEAFSKFWPRLDGEIAARGNSALRRLDDPALQERILDYGLVKLAFIEEVPEGDDRPPVPTVAFPLVSDPTRVSASVEPTDDDSECLAMIRTASAGSRLAASFPPFELESIEGAGIRGVEVWGVVQSAGDSPTEGAPPAGLTHLVGRVMEAAEGENSFNRLPMWRVVLDLGEFLLPVLARGDIWTRPPIPGDRFEGEVWIFARLARGAP